MCNFHVRICGRCFEIQVPFQFTPSYLYAYKIRANFSNVQNATIVAIMTHQICELVLQPCQFINFQVVIDQIKVIISDTLKFEASQAHMFKTRRGYIHV